MDGVNPSGTKSASELSKACAGPIKGMCWPYQGHVLDLSAYQVVPQKGTHTHLCRAYRATRQIYLHIQHGTASGFGPVSPNDFFIMMMPRVLGIAAYGAYCSMVWGIG